MKIDLGFIGACFIIGLIIGMVMGCIFNNLWCIPIFIVILFLLGLIESLYES